jgi:hypothetical protein
MINFLIGMFIAAVVINSIFSFLDLRVKTYIAYMMEEGQSTITINEEQMKEIAKFAAEYMKEDGKT